MNLKEFITTTLVEIAEGLRDAQSKFAELGGTVNPRGLTDPFQKNIYSFTSPDAMHRNFKLSNVEFDIALTASNEAENKGGIGVFLGSFGVGANTKEVGGQSSVNKIKFSVPVEFPSQYPNKD